MTEIAYEQIQQDELNLVMLFDENIHIDFFLRHSMMCHRFVESLTDEFEVQLNKDVEIIVVTKTE